MKLNQELINTLQGIHDGKPWQWKGASNVWFDADKRHAPCPIRYTHMGIEIRLRPAPDPYAEAKSAWRDGELQFRAPFLGASWHDWSRKCEPAWSESEPAWSENPSCYRRKPKPIWVPLGPEDVPPGSVFRSNDQPDTMFWSVSQVWRDGFYLRGENVDWITAKERMQINRAIPLTGKWDENAWEPCWKEVQP